MGGGLRMPGSSYCCPAEAEDTLSDVTDMVCKRRQWYGCWGAYKKSKIYKDGFQQCCAEQGDALRGEAGGRDEYEEERKPGMCKPRSFLERMKPWGKGCGKNWKKSPDGMMCCREEPRRKKKKKRKGQSASEGS